MDYKEKVIALLNSQELSKEQKEKLENIFPELQESKDERIREAIIRILKGETRYTSKEDTDKYVAWLEKQGESDETKAKMFLINKGYPIDTNGIFPTYEEMYNIIRDGLEEQNPAWSEKDKNLLNRLIGVLDGTNKEDYHEGWEEKFLPWLKTFKERIQPKQCEHLENFDNEEDYGIVSLYHAIRILERTIGRVTGYQSDDGILSHEAAINAVKDLYEKQYAQKHYSDFNANDWYVSKVDGKIHKITYNPTNKFEPKFRVGDFIANDYCSGKVIEITNDGYLLDTGQGIPFSCEHNAHLWSINDAKDGDVLVCNINKAEIGGDIEKLPNMTPTIFIYQNVVRDSDYIHSYYSLYNKSSLRLQNATYYNAFVCNIQPATKEQQELLFQKIEEAGYKWNNKKKELKKIEPKINLELLISVLRKHLYTCVNKITATELIDKIKADLNIK